MFTIQLFHNNKRINSTKLPTEAGDSFSCEMKASSSILFPVVEIRTENDNSIIPLYNYAYISDFKRYYWIDDIVYDMGFWTISMHCDALASFRTDIMNSIQYVVRSSSSYDDNIVDTMYLSKEYTYTYEVGHRSYEGISGDVSKVYVESHGAVSAQYFFGVGITAGSFVVGVVGDNTTGVTFYSFSNANFKAFINSALTFTPSDMNDVSNGVANAVFNPIQYITSVRWFPIPPYYASTTSSIKVGGYTIPGSYTAGIVSTGEISSVYMEIDIPKHPSGHNYMNLSPYTELSLILPPFGIIPLDTTKLFNSESITVQIDIDFCYGMATLYVQRETPGTPPPFIPGANIVYSASAEYGVTLPISSLVMDWKAGAAISAMQFLKSAATNGISNPFSNKEMTSPAVSREAGAGRGNGPSLSRRTLPERSTGDSVVVNMLDKAMDLTASALGQLSTSGAIGSFLAFLAGYVPMVEAWFKNVVDRDITRFGAPLYQSRKLLTLSGFCVCANASIGYLSGVAPMQEEIATIQTVLNSGVYLE